MTAQSSAPPASGVPLWATRIALEATLISLQQFSTARQEWAGLSSNTLRGIPSLDLDPATGSAVQPTLRDVESVRIPVQGEAWDELQESIRSNAEAVKGLRSFRTVVARELGHIESLLASSGDPSAPSTSNASFLCQFWQHVLFVSLTRGPVVELNTAYAVPLDARSATTTTTPHRLKRRTKHYRNRKAGEKVAKVDIVGGGGSDWVRILTIKRSSLLAEFRVTDSEMGEASSDESDDDGQASGTANSSVAGSGLSQSSTSQSSYHSLFAHLDPATANCSVVTAIEDLLACRTAIEEGDKVRLSFVLSRVRLPSPNDEALSLPMSILASLTEEQRYEKRLQSISNLIERLPGVSLSCPSMPDTMLRTPTGKVLPSELASGECKRLAKAEDFDIDTLFLPAVPSPVAAAAQLKPLPMTQQINLDVSALVALVGDISHMDVPSQGQGTLETLFRTGGLKSVAAQDRSAASAASDSAQATPSRTSTPDTADERRGMDKKGRYLHGRALALQLGLEVSEGKSFLGYLSDASRSAHASQPFKLSVTSEAKGKFDEIMKLVGGPKEQARAKALFDGNVDAFWQGSRHASDPVTRGSIHLPVAVVNFDSEKARSAAVTAPALKSSFESWMRVVVIEGLDDLTSERNGQGPARMSSNSRQTAHTLNTLLCGFDHGMTTLTTNMLSVKWLVKEATKRREKLESDFAPLASEGSITRTVNSLDNFQVPTLACIFVTNPRSLSERMRTVQGQESVADATGSAAQSSISKRTSSEVGAAAAAIPVASSLQHTQPSSCTSSKGKSPKVAQEGQPLQYDDEIAPYSSSPFDCDPSRRRVQAPVRALSYSREGGSASGAAVGVCPLDNDYGLSKVTPSGVNARNMTLDDSYRSSSKLRDPQGAEERGEGLQTLHELNGNSETSSSGQSGTKRSFPIFKSHRRGENGLRGASQSGSRASRALKWLAGPRPAQQLRIRHYWWWPFAVVEERWLKLTEHVGWREPPSIELPLDEDYDEDDHRSSVWARRPAWLRRGASREVYNLEELALPEALRESPPGSSHRSVSAKEPHPATVWRSLFVREMRTNRWHWLLLVLTYIGWILGFAFLVKSLWDDASVVSAATGEEVEPTFYGCTTTYWSQNERCGLDGESCRPFSQTTPVPFRCPTSCAGTVLGAGRAVGTSLPDFVPLVVGGGDARGVYRGDSWVCGAAVHAGIISNSEGGCGQLWLIGTYSGYEGSSANGIDSESFNSTFPVSYFFEPNTQTSRCTDRRSHGYIFNVIMTAFVGFVLQPKLIVWFWTLLCQGFWVVNYISEPREYPPTPGEPMGDFLPTLFIGYALWRLTFRYVFPAFSRLRVEGTIWTLGLYWLGVLLDVVFANVPLQRLVLSDIQSQPGALTSLIIIIIVVICIAINQVRVVRKTGYLPKYLTLAVVGGIIIGLLAAVPETGLRLHHYIIALVLLPFVAFETRLSLLYCSFLLGMFINGAARWGYDGIIQDESVIQGDSPAGTDIPSFLPASNYTGVDAATNSGLVNWEPIPSGSNYDGFDLMVDDVLRMSATGETSFDMGSISSFYIDDASVSNTTFYPGGGQPSNINTTIANQPHFLRLAYTTNGSPGDFTMAATVWFNGTFIEPESGRT